MMVEFFGGPQDGLVVETPDPPSAEYVVPASGSMGYVSGQVDVDPAPVERYDLMRVRGTERVQYVHRDILRRQR